eukprot:6252264-Prymnesium_polylepis.3
MTWRWLEFMRSPLSPRGSRGQPTPWRWLEGVCDPLSLHVGHVDILPHASRRFPTAGQTRAVCGTSSCEATAPLAASGKRER